MASLTNPLEGQAKTRISKAKDHDANCDWHVDQYPWECTCGAIDQSRYEVSPLQALREQDDPSITDNGVIDNRSSLPEDDGSRLAFPMFDGLLAYFPNALAEVSLVSLIGNQQHNPGQEMHWARGKSTDHANKAVRHLIDHGKRDARGVRHTARAAWRILALLQEEIEQDEGYPLSRASRPSELDAVY